MIEAFGHLALDGRVNSEIDLRFAVNAEDLSVLSADSRGQLKAAGTIRGTLADPTIAATAHGGGIHYDGITLEGFDADIEALERNAVVMDAGALA